MPIGEIRAIARNLMPQFLAKNLSSRKIESFLRANYGMSYRRQTLLSDMREFAHLAKYQSSTESYSKTQLFPKSYMDERELRREQKYLIKGRVTIENTETGEIIEEYGSMYTDTYASKEQWEQEYFDFYDSREKYPEKIILSFEPINVAHNAGRPY